MNNSLIRLEAVAEFANNAMALHDTWEAGHGNRSAIIMARLARAMGISEDDIVILKILAQIHDIGKLGISNVTLSRRRMTKSDMDTIHGHPKNGAELIDNMGFDERLFFAILEHHEQWNGGGYPYGIRGLEISLWGRMLLVVDTYDAISSERAHHKARTLTETLKIMDAEAGVKSDPDIYAVFRKMIVVFNE